MIFALLALAVVALLASGSSAAPAAPLDKGLDVKTAAGVSAALATSDPEKSRPENLLAYASALAPTAPASAAALRTRAMLLTLKKTGV